MFLEALCTQLNLETSQSPKSLGEEEFNRYRSSGKLGERKKGYINSRKKIFLPTIKAQEMVVHSNEKGERCEQTASSPINFEEN